MRKKIWKMKHEGSLDSILFCSLVIICFVLFTAYGVKLRMAKNAKFFVDDAVVAAATTAQVMDLYTYANMDELVLDCTGTGNSSGLYETDCYGATKKACVLSYDRFCSSLETALGFCFSSAPDSGGSGYITKAVVKEYTVYNVRKDGIYSCTYDGSVFQDTDRRALNTVRVTTKNETESPVTVTSVYVDLVFEANILGTVYEIPLREYLYNYDG